MKKIAAAILGLALSACADPTSSVETPLNAFPLNAFQSQLQTTCGQTYAGRVTSSDPQDENWRKEILTLGPVTCPDSKTTVLPLAVGPDQSRVWTLRLQDDGKALDFRHAHTLKDGSPDPVTGYGGVATPENSTKARAIFPVDAISKKTFAENGLDVSMTNVWSIDIDSGKTMTYTLKREGRLFVAEFDLEAAE